MYAKPTNYAQPTITLEIRDRLIEHILEHYGINVAVMDDAQIIKTISWTAVCDRMSIEMGYPVHPTEEHNLIALLQLLLLKCFACGTHEIVGYIYSKEEQLPLCSKCHDMLTVCAYQMRENLEIPQITVEKKDCVGY
jgi:hypothetical protein